MDGFHGVFRCSNFGCANLSVKSQDCPAPPPNKLCEVLIDKISDWYRFIVGPVEWSSKSQRRGMIMGKRRSSRTKQVGVIVAGSCVAIALIAGLVSWKDPWSNSQPTPEASLVASNTPLSVTHVTVPWYFKKDQWRADMRTLEGILRYLSDAGELAQTNSAQGLAGDV
jgi:hypothetical protein